MCTLQSASLPGGQNAGPRQPSLDPPPIPLPSPDLSVLNVHCSATGLRRTPSAGWLPWVQNFGNATIPLRGIPTRRWAPLPAPAGAKEFFQRRGAARKRALCAAAAAAAPRDAGWRAAAAGDGSVATTAAARRRVCAGLGAAHGTLNVRLGSWLAACR